MVFYLTVYEKIFRRRRPRQNAGDGGGDGGGGDGGGGDVALRREEYTGF